MQHARLSIHLVLAALLAACSGDATTSPETGGKDSGADALGSDTDVAPDVGADGALDAAPAPCSLQNLGPWKESRALPQPLESASAVVVNGHVFVLGGFSNLKGPLNTVYRARLGQDGALGGWDTLPALPNKVQHHAAFVVGDRIYVTGGDGSKTHDAVHYAVTGSSGELPKWEQAASLPSPRTAHAAVVTDGHVYLLGGMANLTDPASAVASVLYAAVSADGSLGAWKPTTDLPASLFWHSSVVTGGRIYVTGGVTGSSKLVKSALVATPDADGKLSAWSPLAAKLSPGRLRCGVVADTSALVLVGGSTGEAGLDETLFGFPDPSTGTFSTWTTGPALPAHRFGAAVVATGGHLFAFGGYIDSVMSPPSDKVYVGSFCR